jgi:hypothetical protein
MLKENFKTSVVLLLYVLHKYYLILVWEDNIKMDFQEEGCGDMDWIKLAQDRDSWRALVNKVMNLRVSYNAGNFLTSSKPVSFSRIILLHGVSKYVCGIFFQAVALNLFRILK